MNFATLIIAATTMIILGAAIRKLAINHLPKISMVIIWVIISIRLLIPFSITVHVPFLDAVIELATEINRNGVGQSSETHLTTTAFNEVEINIGGILQSEIPVFMPPVTQSGNNTLQAQYIYNTTYNTIEIQHLLFWIWLIGVIIFALHFIINHYRFRKAMRDSLPLENNFIFNQFFEYGTSRYIQVRHTHKITSPLTYGILRPIILLPSFMDWQDEAKLKYIFTHEHVHIRRFDYIWKALFAMVLCIHWFNPFVWLMFILANRDIELSCDEAVLKSFGSKSKSEYALMLLDMAENTNEFAMSYNGFSKNAIEERINMMVNMRKKSILATAGAFILVGSMAACSTFNAVPSEIPAPDVYIESSVQSLAAQNLSTQLIYDVEADYELPIDELNYVVTLENMHEAANVGIEAIKLLFGVELDVTDMEIQYFPRREEFLVQVFQESSELQPGELGMELMEDYSTIFTQYLNENADKETLNSFNFEYYLRNAFPEIDFTNMQIALIEPTEAGRWWMSSTQGQYTYQFSLCAETLVLSMVQLWGDVDIHAERPMGEVVWLEATEQHNYEITQHAMQIVESLGILEGEIVRAKIDWYNQGLVADNFIQHSTAGVIVESAIGESVELRINGFIEGEVQITSLSNITNLVVDVQVSFGDAPLSSIPPFGWVYR